MCLNKSKWDNLMENNLGQEEATSDKVAKKGLSEVLAFELITENIIGKEKRKCKGLEMRMSGP